MEDKDNRGKLQQVKEKGNDKKKEKEKEAVNGDKQDELSVQLTNDSSIVSK